MFSSTSSTAKRLTGVGDRPESVKLSPDGKLAYIGDWNTGTISVVETTKYTVVHTIATVPFSVDELAVNQDGSLLLVVNAVTPRRRRLLDGQRLRAAEVDAHRRHHRGQLPRGRDLAGRPAALLHQ